MTHLHDGQCGLCSHFGEHDHSGQHEQLLQIRESHEASEGFVEECGHPKHADLHLVVTPISGCDGFEPAKAEA